MYGPSEQLGHKFCWQTAGDECLCESRHKTGVCFCRVKRHRPVQPEMFLSLECPRNADAHILYHTDSTPVTTADYRKSESGLKKGNNKNGDLPREESGH